MNHPLLIAAILAIGVTEPAHAKMISQSQELIVTQPKDLPEAAQSAGQSIVLHSLSNGSTYLYVEQNMGKRLAILDVTDPAHIKSVGSVTLDSPSARLRPGSEWFKYSDLLPRQEGAAFVDFRRAKQPTMVIADGLTQAGR